MSEGVEWAVHTCLVLAWLGDAEPVPTGRLAATFELPPTYLNKQLQALSRAGILRSTPGPRARRAVARHPPFVGNIDETPCAGDVKVLTMRLGIRRPTAEYWNRP